MADIIHTNKEVMVVGMWAKSFTTDGKVSEIYIRTKDSKFTLVVDAKPLNKNKKPLVIGDMIELVMDNSEMA